MTKRKQLNINISPELLQGLKITAKRSGKTLTELVSEIAVAKRLEATYNEIVDIIHPHPTISEVILEASIFFEYTTHLSSFLLL